MSIHVSDGIRVMKHMLLDYVIVLEVSFVVFRKFMHGVVTLGRIV